MKLADIQQQFSSKILNYNPLDSSEVDYIVSDDKSSAQQRLFIYQNAYATCLSQALQNDYPALYAYLGHKEFTLLAQAYSQQYPPTNPNLRWFGKHLAQFLRDQTSPQPLLSELAAFEWALGESFDAIDEQVLSLADLQAISAQQWGDLRIQFCSSLRVLGLNWNVVQRRQALEQQETPPELQQNAYPTRWIVWRCGLEPHWRSLPVDEAWALQTLQQQATIADVCAGLTEWIDEAHVPQRIVEILAHWLESELITALR